MVVNPLKVFLFLAGGTVAAGATAYVSGALDPYIYDKGGRGGRRSAGAAPSDPAAPKSERLPDAEDAACNGSSRASLRDHGALSRRQPGGSRRASSG